MGRRKLLMVTVIAALAAAASGFAASEVNIDAKAAFAAMKQLEGTWESKSADGKVSRSVFELTGGGTVLLERYTNEALPGGGHMATAYHLDGADLVLTHYCMANNQPVLRAERFDATTKEIQFEFLRAGNLPSPSAGHMRRAKYRFIDADHFVTEWEFFENGQKKMTETETFTRARK
jgi:hypothetical protein